MSLFAELKRRKVFRVAVVYAATAFVILQAADIMLPRMGIPDWGVGLGLARRRPHLHRRPAHRSRSRAARSPLLVGAQAGHLPNRRAAGRRAGVAPSLSGAAGARRRRARRPEGGLRDRRSPPRTTQPKHPQPRAARLPHRATSAPTGVLRSPRGRKCAAETFLEAPQYPNRSSARWRRSSGRSGSHSGSTRSNHCRIRGAVASWRR